MKIKTFEEYLSSEIPFYEYDNENFLDFLSAVKFKLNAPFIHVTGTAGKSAIVEFLSNIYTSAGYKIGTIKSSDFVSEKDAILEKYPGIAAFFEKNWKIINKFELTISEVLFYFLLEEFNKNNFDLLIIETYMGGFFDVTNIDKKPVLAIVNNAGLEHCDTLGKSVSEIALSKCGIIKDDSLVLLNSYDSDIEFVVNEETRKTKSKLVRVAEFYDYNIFNLEKLEIGYHPFPKFTVNSSALYNRENVACVLEAINLLKNQFPVTNEQIQTGLNKPLSFGYFDVVKKGEKTIIFDKANNPFSIEKLCKSLRFSFEDTHENASILFAVSYEKNLEKMLSILSYVTHDIQLTTFDDDDARDEMGFYLFLQDYSFNPDFKDALNNILASEKNVILVTGNEKFVNLVKNYVNTL